MGLHGVGWGASPPPQIVSDPSPLSSCTNTTLEGVSVLPREWKGGEVDPLRLVACPVNLGTGGGGTRRYMYSTLLEKCAEF
jgi:hypothetical protein